MKRAYFKRKRLYLGVALLLVVPVAILLLDKFVWYPNSPRGVFDRIQFGMDREEVEGLLTTLEDGEWQLPNCAFVCTPKGGLSIHDEGDAVVQSYIYSLYKRARSRWDAPRQAEQVEKVSNAGAIFIDFDNEGKVSEKRFFEYAGQWPGFVKRIGSWFGL